MRVIIVERSGPENGARAYQSALRPGAVWHWRLFSAVLLLALLPAIMLVRLDAANAANGPTSGAKASLNVVVLGDFYSYGYSSSVDPTLRSASPPTLQALNQIQAANPGVQINVMFLPVLDATSARLYQTVNPGSRFASPPQINAVKHANIVIVGVGANDLGFTNWVRSVLFASSPPSAKTSAQYMALFENGSYLQGQTSLLEDIATRAASGASIVTVGYPKVTPEQLPSGLTWWSPFSWTEVSQQRANTDNQLVSALNTANNEAASIVGVQHPGLHFLYADLTGALQGKGPLGPLQVSSGANPANSTQSAVLKQTLVGSDLLPYVDQAVNNELVAQGVSGAQHVQPFTPKSKWQLTLAVPVQIWLQQPKSVPSGSGATPPQNTAENPANQPPSSASQPSNPSDHSPSSPSGNGASGQADSGSQPSGSGPAQVSVVPAGIGGHPPADHRPPSGQNSGSGAPTVSPQPSSTGGTSGATQPSGAGHSSGATQPPASDQGASATQLGGAGASGVHSQAAGPAPVTTGGSQPLGNDQSSGSPLANPRLAGNGQASGAPMSADSSQPSVSPQPSAIGGESSAPVQPSSQPIAAPQPTSVGQPPGSTSGTCAFSGVPCTQGSPGTPGGPLTVMPVTPAPIPAPITANLPPDGEPSPGTGANPATTAPQGTAASPGGTAPQGTAASPGGTTAPSASSPPSAVPANPSQVGGEATPGGATSVPGVTSQAPTPSTGSATASPDSAVAGA